jgi:hypothetical protein
MFTVRTDNGVLLSRYVLLATGVRDHLPAIEGAENAVTRSVLRVCPICDAFEAIDQRIAIIGDGAMAEREAEFLRDYSDRVTVLDIGLYRSSWNMTSNCSKIRSEEDCHGKPRASSIYRRAEGPDRASALGRWGAGE